MLPFHPTFFLVYKIMGQSTEEDSGNTDFAHHLSHKPALTPDPLYLRLLPRIIRRPLKAHFEARAYEKTLVRIWETSPHLMEDIGVVFEPRKDLPDHLVVAPQRVVDKLAAMERAKSVPPTQAAAHPAKPKPKGATNRPPVREAFQTAPFANRASWALEG